MLLTIENIIDELSRLSITPVDMNDKELKERTKLIQEIYTEYIFPSIRHVLLRKYKNNEK